MICQGCGREAAEEDLVRIEGRLVCADCKRVVVQQIREGWVAPPKVVIPPNFGDHLLGHGEFIKTTWRVFCRDWVAILSLTLLVSIPINFVLMWVTPDDSLMSDEESLRETGRFIRRSMALDNWIGIIATLGIYKIVSERVQGRAMGFWGASAHALRRYWPAIWTGIIEQLITFFLLLMLVVPGVIWSGYYIFSVGAVSLAEISGKKALDVSKAMVKGRWWAVVGRALVVFFLAVLPAALVSIGFEFGPWAEDPSIQLVADVLTDLPFAFSAVGIAVLFLNLRAMEVWGGSGTPS